MRMDGTISRCVRNLLRILPVASSLFFRQAGAQDSLADPAQQLVLSVLQKVETENRIVGNYGPDSLTSLPVGIQREIGNVRYTIAIDSMVFLPDGARLNAYMALQFPGSGQKLCFSARRIAFNPKGVIGGAQARLILVSSHTIDLGPDLKLRLPADGSNFVDWNCNGFEGVQLKGEFLFSKEKLIPDSTQTWDRQVSASFQCYAQNLQDLLTEVNITPFCIRGLRDWSFTVSRAVIDLSASRNATGMVFPPGYGFTTPQWTGFYLETLSIRLPTHISASGTRTEIRVSKCLIDDSGFSGNVHVNNVFGSNGGDMSGWGFSVDGLGARWESNRLTGGSFTGKIRLPVMDSSASIRYNAEIVYNELSKESDYRFCISPTENISFHAFAARVDVFPTSYIEVAKRNGRLEPKAVLNGKISFHHKKFKCAKVDVVNLTLIAKPPYLVNGMISASPAAGPAPESGNYALQLHQIALIIDPVFPRLKVDFTLNLSDDPNHALSARSSLILQAKHESHWVTHTGDHPYSVKEVKWQFDRIRIGALGVNVETAPFYLCGTVQFFEEDPVYGDGFRGQLRFMIRNVLKDTASAQCVFGNVGHRYWYADVFLPVNIPLGGAPFTLTRISGGLYRRMRPQYSTSAQCIQTLTQNPQPGSPSQQYFPDAVISTGFKAGCSFRYTPSERAVNGDVMLEVLFTSSGGLHSVRLDGNVYMLCTPAERLLKPAAVKGTAVILYDHVARVFDAQFNVQMTAGSQLSGQGMAGIHVDPQHWYFMAGRPGTPAQVQLANIASASAYFMVGNSVDPMAPVPSQVSALVANSGLMQQRNETQLGNGSGFCAGIRFASSFYKEIGWDFFTLYGGFSYGCGFDMMLTRLGEQVRCGDISQPGMNSWLAQGQMYLYMQGTIGIKGHIQPNWCNANWCQGDFDITLLNGSLAVILAARGPNPSYFSGTVACSYSILGIVNGICRFDFEAGNNCTFTGS